MKNPELFRQRLLERMSAVGTNPSRLSLTIGGRDTVRMILSGRSKSPRADTLEGLSRELQCDVRYLLGEIDEPGAGPPVRTSHVETAEVQLTQLPNGKARLQINKVIPFALALEILTKIEGAGE